MHTHGTHIEQILRTIEGLNHLSDMDAILDAILREARALTDADAGTIFLAEDGRLTFAYLHNDTLFGHGRNTGVSPETYRSDTLPIDNQSVVGYAALSGTPLVHDDVYALDPGLPYRFNSSFDEKSGYRTRSTLTLPLRTFGNKLVGVMQLINARGENGQAVPFTAEHRALVPIFAQHAAGVVERGRTTRELILRMTRMAELRDPAETGAHVQRVGAVSAELYHQWALDHGVPLEEIRRYKDKLRIAAMLHDVGKVGIPDIILRKPARLSDDEYGLMKRHTVYGARIFADDHSELDALCREVALRHHERWSGGGYPGRLDDIFADEYTGLPMRGEAIPLAARITALADVYDALVSPRCYKDPWPEERVFEHIRAESGRHFDPGVVDAFFEVYPVIRAIHTRFRDAE
ncbi:metal dependent phosphohydrolase with GAF sensor [Desulfovibrio sp. X2]|uniref:GAF and HD-GYP domain-containing protein n=1 Tax=Desulfovibrio sp. X2 TaxID=941449 RepID=UPI000358AFDB|nr:HD domain-containing phosphohydrolase [Desulfovibrio sp. X2]EPR41235.1 metal dependent phosphohydrolase with GAF sensor [Desulfovibrio sp. X2]